MRHVLVGAIIAGVGTTLAPLAAFALILSDPELASSKFISAADMSTGPAFDACLLSWLVLTVGALALGGAVALAGIARDAVRAKGS